MINVRLMQASDVPWASELSCQVGWNQLPGDWRLLLELEPEGVFLTEDDGRRCGTASIVTYGLELGWIGMVLVKPEFRRRGIGTMLVERCLTALRSRGVRSAWLDATDAGRQVYLKMGFRDERPITRYAGAACQPGQQVDRGRAMTPADLESIRLLDTSAFGAARGPLLAGLLKHGRGWIVDGRTAPSGFGFSRPGREADYIGPIVAQDAETAEAIVTNLLHALPGRQVYWDIPGGNPRATALAERLGFTPRRRLTRMVLGEATRVGQAELVHAAAGFELG